MSCDSHKLEILKFKFEKLSDDELIRLAENCSNIRELYIRIPSCDYGYDGEEEEKEEEITHASISAIALCCSKLEYFEVGDRDLVAITDACVHALIEHCPQLKFGEFHGKKVRMHLHLVTKCHEHHRRSEIASQETHRHQHVKK